MNKRINYGLINSLLLLSALAFGFSNCRRKTPDDSIEKKTSIAADSSQSKSLNMEIASNRQAQIYINCLKKFPYEVSHAFSWTYVPGGNLPEHIFDYTPNLQIFHDPRGVTDVCFFNGSYGGEAVFKTGTDTIIRVLPWSEDIKDRLKGKFTDISFIVYGYTFEETNGVWQLRTHIIADVDDKEYRLFTFNASMGLNSGSWGVEDAGTLCGKPKEPKEQGE